MTITIVLADDHELVREGVRCLLEIEDDFDVIGETSDGLQVVPLVQRLKPRVLVVSMAMPGLSGLDITREAHRRVPDTAVVVLTMFGDERYLLESLRNGAAAYVMKQARGAELVRGIRTAAAGRRYVSAPWSQHPIETWMRRANSTVINGYTSLTAREREVFQLVVKGESSARIARRLSISRRTAEAHRAKVMQKLHLTNHVDLVRFGLAHGLLRLSGGPATMPKRPASE